MTTSITLTNELIPAFNYKNLLEDYMFYAIDIPYNSKEKNYYKTIYAEIKRELNPKARYIKKTRTGHEYILAFDKSFSLDNTDYNIRKIGLSELKDMSSKGILTILLSLMLGKSSFFELSSNPYNIFYTYATSPRKITALRIDLKETNKKVYLSLAATSFKRTQKDTRDCYIQENGILMPYRKEIHKDVILYQKGNFKSQKTTVPFLGLDSKGFPQSKTYFLDLLHKDIQAYLSSYVDLSFKSREIEIYATGEDKEKRKRETASLIREYGKKIGKIHIADLSGDSTFAKTLHTMFIETYGNDIEITLSGETSRQIPLITITKPKAYYEANKGEKDPYSELVKLDIPTQNITIDTDINNTILNVLMKELSLKCELYGYGTFLEHQAKDSSIRFFHIADKDDNIFYKATIENNSVVTDKPTETEQAVLEDIMFEVPQDEIAESIIMTKEGNTMLITKTHIFPLPYFQDLATKYMESAEDMFFSTEEILSLAKRIDTYPCTVDKLTDELNRIKTKSGIPSTKLMSLNMKIISKGLKNLIEKYADRKLRFSVRDKASKSLYAGMLGITYFTDEDNTVLYHTGIASGALKASIDKNSPYRRITPVKGEILIDAILPFMEEYFIKYNELTVLPYPLKYAREGYEIINKKRKEK